MRNLIGQHKYSVPSIVYINVVRVRANKQPSQDCNHQVGPEPHNLNNFIGWKREFERAAKANDVLDCLTGEEVGPPRPRREDYCVKLIEIDTRRPIRAKNAALAFTPSTDDDGQTDDAQVMSRSRLRPWWHIQGARSIE